MALSVCVSHLKTMAPLNETQARKSKKAAAAGADGVGEGAEEDGAGGEANTIRPSVSSHHSASHDT